MKILLLLTLLVVPSFGVAQNAEQPSPHKWRGMMLGESTPEDSVKAFGEPTSDKIDKLTVYRIQSWLAKKTSQKIFRVLEFKKLEGIDKAKLYYLDEKLVAIDLDLKKSIPPAALSNIYGIDFQPIVGAADIAFRPRDYETSQGRVYPKTYPVVYSMVATAQRSFVAAMVENVPSFGGAL